MSGEEGLLVAVHKIDNGLNYSSSALELSDALNGGALTFKPRPNGSYRIAAREVDPTVHYISFDGKSGNIILNAGIGNPYPLFWYMDESKFLLSRDVCSIVNFISRIGGQVVLDRVAVYESLIFDGPLVHRTYFEHINKTQIGERLTVDLRVMNVARCFSWRPVFEADELVRKSESELSGVARELILALSRRMPDEKVLIPLTGGFDSRLIASLQKYEKRLTASSYTFQRGPSYETFCAKKIASALGFDHVTINLTVDCYDSFARRVIVESGGLISPMHVHGLFSCRRAIGAEKVLPRVFGYFGDPITGAMSEEMVEGAWRDTPEKLFNTYLSKSILRFSEVENLAGILEDVSTVYQEFLEIDRPLSFFHEYWRIQQRQNNLISHIFNHHRVVDAVSVYEPFIDSEFCQFFLGLPKNLRKNRYLFKKVGREMWPNIFGLPSNHFSEDSIMSKLEICSNELQSRLDRFLPKQRVFNSPFKYEQHEKLLNNELREWLRTSYLAFLDLYPDQKLPKVIPSPLWSMSNNAEAFRLITLKVLLENMR